MKGKTVYIKAYKKHRDGFCSRNRTVSVLVIYIVNKDQLQNIFRAIATVRLGFLLVAGN